MRRTRGNNDEPRRPKRVFPGRYPADGQEDPVQQPVFIEGERAQSATNISAVRYLTNRQEARMITNVGKTIFAAFTGGLIIGGWPADAGAIKHVFVIAMKNRDARVIY